MSTKSTDVDDHRSLGEVFKYLLYFQLSKFYLAANCIYKTFFQHTEDCIHLYLPVLFYCGF